MGDRQCIKVVNGKRCSRKALEGSNYCREHQLRVKPNRERAHAKKTGLKEQVMRRAPHAMRKKK